MATSDNSMMSFSNPSTDAIMGQKSVICFNKKEQIVEVLLPNGRHLSVEDFSNDKNLIKQLSSSASNSFLIFLLTRLASQNNFREKDIEKINTRIVFSVREYMKCMGLKSYPKAIEKIKKLTHIFFSCWLEWSGTQPPKLKHKTRILSDQTQIKYGKIELGFTRELTIELINSFVIWIPKYYWKAGGVAKDLLYRICVLRNIKSNKRKKNQNENDFIVKTTNLLKYVNGLPSYDSVRKSNNRNLNERIIKLFEEGLDDLKRAEIINWEYCGSNGRPLAEEELNLMDRWKTFSKIFVRISIYTA